MAKLKINNPIGNVLGGIILIIVSTVILAFNEKDVVKNTALIQDAKENYIQVESSPIDNKNTGKLIATNGTIDVNGTSISDTAFSLTLADTAAIYRTVEMYQWDEDEDNSGDDTTYSYTKKWDDDVIDSSNFNTTAGHENPTKKAYENYDIYNENAKLGDFNLSERILNQLSSTTLSGLDSLSLNIPSGYKIVGNYITNATDIENPEVGDIRISFKTIGLIDMSVIGEQLGEDIIQYTISNGKSLLHASNGIHDGSYLIGEVDSANKVLKWFFRILGILLSMFGFASLVSVFSFIVSFVPVIGSTIKSFFGFIGSMIGFAYSLVVIAVAWLACRPIIGIACLVIVGIVIGLIIVLVSKSKKNKEVQSGLSNNQFQGQQMQAIAQMQNGTQPQVMPQQYQQVGQQVVQQMTQQQYQQVGQQVGQQMIQQAIDNQNNNQNNGNM